MDANVFGGGYFILVIIVRYVCFGEDNIVQFVFRKPVAPISIVENPCTNFKIILLQLLDAKLEVGPPYDGFLDSIEIFRFELLW